MVIRKVILKILKGKRSFGATPTPGEILQDAKEIDPTFFKNWSAKGIANTMKRYGINTVKSCGRRVYSRVEMEDLRVIQDTYGLELGVEADEETF